MGSNYVNNIIYFKRLSFSKHSALATSCSPLGCRVLFLAKMMFEKIDIIILLNSLMLRHNIIIRQPYSLMYNSMSPNQLKTELTKLVTIWRQFFDVMEII